MGSGQDGAKTSQKKKGDDDDAVNIDYLGSLL